MKPVRTFCQLIILIPCLAVAQNQEDIALFLSAGKEDGAKLMEAYFTPVVKSISYGMAAGWATTAKTHKTFGVDIGVSINTSFIPKSDDYFNPAKLGLSPTTTFTSQASNGLAPTFMGPDDATQYTFSGDLDGNTQNGNESITINGPEGLNIKKHVGVAALPVPVIQVGIGIIKNTDLKVRLLPTMNFNGTSIKEFGVGIMHDVKQHIPGVKNLPFDLSVLVSYNSVRGESDLSNSDNTDARPDSPDGRGIYKFNSYGAQVLVSKKLAVLTVYGGAGYTAIKTNVALKGTYTIEATPASFDLTNPVNIDLKNRSPFFVAGARLKFGPFFLNGNYTIQKYKTLSVGLGFSFL